MKKKTKQKKNVDSLSQPILEIDYEDPLFVSVCHPTKPILITGTATGHIYCNNYDSIKLEDYRINGKPNCSQLKNDLKLKEDVNTISSENRWYRFSVENQAVYNDYISLNWKTKRHKGSCRNCIFENLNGSIGEKIYSLGSDKVIKKAHIENGKVSDKVCLKKFKESENDQFSKLSHSNTHPFLLIGSDNGNIYVLDSNNISKNSLKFNLSNIHDDTVNHILPMHNVSPYHYLTIGSSTLSHIDIRKGIVTQSEDQGDELLCMCYPNVDTESNDTVIVSHSEGILSLWKNSYNKFNDQISRIKINKLSSIDVVIAAIENSTDSNQNLWCGDGDGFLYKFDYTNGKIFEKRSHSNCSGENVNADGVINLDIDYDYRLVSAGMDSLKIWSHNTKKNESNSSDESLLNDNSDLTDNDDSF